MRIFFLILCFLHSVTNISAQSLAGNWSGFFMDETAPRVSHTETKIVMTETRAYTRQSPNPSPMPNLSRIAAPGASPSPTLSPYRRSPNRSVQIKTPYRITCVQNPDSTYDFISFTKVQGKTIEEKMEYEIIGNDSLYLVEINDSVIGENSSLRQMLLQISWEKKGKKKVLKMKGFWYKHNDSTPQGEIVLYKED